MGPPVFIHPVFTHDLIVSASLCLVSAFTGQSRTPAWVEDLIGLQQTHWSTSSFIEPWQPADQPGQPVLTSPTTSSHRRGRLALLTRKQPRRRTLAGGQGGGHSR